MPVKEDFTTYTEVDEGSAISRSADAITIVTWASRTANGLVYVDKGAGYIAAGLDYTQYFAPSATAVNAYVFCFCAGNATTGYKPSFDNGDKGIFFSYHKSGAGVPDLYMIAVTGVATFVDDTDAYAWSDGTTYNVNVTRTGTVFTALVYEGAILRATLTVDAAAGAADYRYLYGLSGLDDDFGASSVSAVLGPLWDNNANAVSQDEAAAIALLMETIRVN